MRLFAALLILILLSGTASAKGQEAEEEAAQTAQSVYSGILSYQGAGTYDMAQKWISGALSTDVGSGDEWYILALAQSDHYDFSAYEAALLRYLTQNTVASASSRLKFALCLKAIGSDHPIISELLDSSVGKQGIMSLVFGLHLFNNRTESRSFTADQILSQLISLQCADGGFSITGQYGDVDVTAMALQALASYPDPNAESDAAIDRALQFLSEKQQPSGGYSSYGAENPESTAQVIIALASLGIDPTADARFCKNGSTPLDALLRYRLPNGSFCHREGEETNHTATVQVFCAMTAYLRYAQGKGAFYHLDAVYAPPADSADDSSDTESIGSRPSSTATGAPLTSAQETEKAGEHADRSGSYKLPVTLILLGIGGCGCLLLILLRKGHRKNLLSIGIATAILIAVVWLTDFRSADDYYHGGDPEKENVIGTVTLTIRCDTVAGRADHIPENGIILEKTSFPIAEGDTVYTVLTDAAKKYRISVENNGSAAHVYIAGIAYLYEFDYGDLSGWMYEVNGEQPSVGAGEYRLKDGDAIEWRYTCNLGEDLT